MPLPTSVPTISLRISIAWPNSRLPEQHAPHEPTSTLVLRFTAYYLDLRTSVVDNSVAWAQAGAVIKTPNKDDPAGLPDVDFLPIADSLDPLPPGLEKLPDSGSFITLPNGDVEEKGAMYNPDSRAPGETWGRNEEYIEVWRRLPAGELTKIEQAGESMRLNVTECLLLEAPPTHNDLGSIGKLTTHTFIGRVGPRALGISVTSLMPPSSITNIPVYISTFKDYLVDAAWVRAYSFNGPTPHFAANHVPSSVLSRLDLPLPQLPITTIMHSYDPWTEGATVAWPHDISARDWVVMDRSLAAISE